MKKLISEEIERIMLLSKYDSKKTLTENKQIILELKFVNCGGIFKNNINKLIHLPPINFFKLYGRNFDLLMLLNKVG